MMYTTVVVTTPLLGWVGGEGRLCYDDGWWTQLWSWQLPSLEGLGGRV